MGKQVVYFKTFDEDIVENSNQNYKLPKDYVWVHQGKKAKLARRILYAVSYVFTLIYAYLILHVRIIRNVDMKDYDSGAVIYGNHTQPIGDVFVPGLLIRPKKCYTICSPANLGIPIIGRLLPWLGAIPIPDTFRKMPAFLDAIKTRLEEKNCIIIYPEAHVWPYYTKIRPYEATSFDYPVRYKVPAFCMTTTYQSRRFSSKPRITVYLDGPFYSNESLTKQQQKEDLRNQVYACMKERSRHSTYEYIQYRKEGDDSDE